MMMSSFPEYCLLPRDPIDERYVLSFRIDGSEEGTASAVEFFAEYGFVVVSNIFSDHNCRDTRESMWAIIENAHPGFVRDDISTWDIMKSSGKYGLSTRGPCFHRTLVQNRQNPLLASILAALVDTTVEDLVVSHDRFTIYRATAICVPTAVSLSNKTNEIGDRDGEVAHVPDILNGSKYATGERNVHLDLNPWWWLESSKDILSGVDTLKYDDPQDFIRENNMVVECQGRHVQCVLNFADNVENDGGTIIVPKFHRHVRQWCKEHAHLRKKLPWLTFTKIVDNNSNMKSNDNVVTINAADSTNNFVDVNNQCTGTLKNISTDGTSLQISQSIQFPKQNNNSKIDTENVIQFEGTKNDDIAFFPSFINDPKGKKKEKKQKEMDRKHKNNSSSSNMNNRNIGSPVDYEARLLALAQRITMRQGSVLIWDQTMFHGSSPNSSSSCRMAQFMKAYPRSKTLSQCSRGHESVTDHIREPSLRPLSAVKSLPVKDLSCSFQTSSSFSTSPTIVHSITDVDVDVHKDIEIEMNLASLIPSERCIRRAEALRRELHMAGSLDCVTQLGRQLFCLDVLI